MDNPMTEKRHATAVLRLHYPLVERRSGAATDGLLQSVLSSSITYIQGLAEDEEVELAESLEENLDDFLEQPDSAIDKLVGNEKFVEMSQLDYKNPKKFMAGQHPSWEKNCGLVQVKDEATGRFEWLPP